jgi:penicillin-binding protein 2
LNEKKKDDTGKRAGVLATVVLVALASLIGQLGNLSLRQGGTYLAEASAQATRTLPVPAPRGIIYDRNMKPLAANQPDYVIVMHYPYFTKTDLVERLAGILGLPVSQLQARITKQQDHPYEPVRVATSVTPAQVARVLENGTSLPGVEVQEEPSRYYPEGELAAQTVGYVSEINSEQLDKLETQGYVSGELIGQAGLESHYEQVLHGKPGKEQVQVNNAFEPLGQIGVEAPTPGNNLVLTLDSGLTKTAERALDWAMYRLQTIPNVGDGHAYPDAKAGAVVVMNPKTGAILAMVSRPSYDPNLFTGGISEKDWNRLNNDPFLPLLNRATQSAYQPGSTWKMMTGTASLAAGVTTPYETVFSGRVYEPTGQHDWVPWGHGSVDLPNALRLSSDIYFYEMGRRLGIDRLVSYAKGFGFGSPTGVDLDSEAAGFLPDEAYREKNGWFLGQTTSAAIGQIFTVTPIQLARYVSAIANGGKLMQPYLVQSVQDVNGQTVQETQPKVTGTLPVPADAIRVAIQGMKLVNSPTGTSDFAQWPLPGIVTAGKTGTAENPPKADYGLFVSFAPADDPQIAVAVVIEQAGHGGSVSPVARSIYSDYFHVPLPKNDPARIPDDFEPVTPAQPAKTTQR